MAARLLIVALLATTATALNQTAIQEAVQNALDAACNPNVTAKVGNAFCAGATAGPQLAQQISAFVVGVSYPNAQFAVPLNVTDLPAYVNQNLGQLQSAVQAVVQVVNASIQSLKGNAAASNCLKAVATAYKTGQQQLADGLKSNISALVAQAKQQGPENFLPTTNQLLLPVQLVVGAGKQVALTWNNVLVCPLTTQLLIQSSAPAAYNSIKSYTSAIAGLEISQYALQAKVQQQLNNQTLILLARSYAAQAQQAVQAAQNGSSQAQLQQLLNQNATVAQLQALQAYGKKLESSSNVPPAFQPYLQAFDGLNSSQLAELAAFHNNNYRLASRTNFTSVPQVVAAFQTQAPQTTQAVQKLIANFTATYNALSVENKNYLNQTLARQISVRSAIAGGADPYATLSQAIADQYAAYQALSNGEQLESVAPGYTFFATTILPASYNPVRAAGWQQQIAAIRAAQQQQAAAASS